MKRRECEGSVKRGRGYEEKHLQLVPRVVEQIRKIVLLLPSESHRPSLDASCAVHPGRGPTNGGHRRALSMKTLTTEPSPCWKFVELRNNEDRLKWRGHVPVSDSEKWFPTRKQALRSGVAHEPQEIDT